MFNLILQISRKVCNSKKVKDDGNDVDENDPLPTNTPNGNTKVHQLYEMLYTGDKMKKLKKWMDGTLRMDQVTMMGTFWLMMESTCYSRRMQMVELTDGTEITTAQHLFQIGGQKDDNTLKSNSDTEESRSGPRIPSGKRKLLPRSQSSIKPQPDTTNVKRGRTSSELLQMFGNK